MTALPHDQPYADLERAWRALHRIGIDVREVLCAGNARSLLVVDLPAQNGYVAGAPAIALAAGVHGDEPAAPWALLSLARDGLLDRRFSYRIWPCTNPTGYANGTRTNADGHDVNRSFGEAGLTLEARAVIAENRGQRFALSFDMHEDHEASGFYCFEPYIAGLEPLGPAVVQAVEDAGFPIQELHDEFDLGYPPESPARLRKLERGRVVPDVRAETDSFGAGLPYSMYLLQGTSRRAMTLESPRRLSWEARVAIHRIAVVTALERLAARGARLASP